jgi:glutathione S-transferase
MTLVLHAYRFSVYAWIARAVLAEKRVGYDYVEVNPFAPDMPVDYLTLHPFRRVPTLVHDGFVLYETAAITRYVDEAFPGPSLRPAASRARARMAQIISVIDAYGYWPMVRRVFSHRVFRPRNGEPSDEHEIQRGVSESERVVAALEDLAATATYLTGDAVSLADLHLAPMIAYFTMAPEGRAILARYPTLSAWWDVMRSRDSLVRTDPKIF